MTLRAAQANLIDDPFENVADTFFRLPKFIPPEDPEEARAKRRRENILVVAFSVTILVGGAMFLRSKGKI